MSKRLPSRTAQIFEGLRQGAGGFHSEALMDVTNEGEEEEGETSSEAGINFQEVRLTICDFVVDATEAFEIDGPQHSTEQLEIRTMLDDSESFVSLSFDGRLALKLVFDVQRLDDFLADKKDVSSKLARPGYHFLTEKCGIGNEITP